jgi:hypothetical protein
MTVPLKDGAFTCPRCKRPMKAIFGKYGAEILNSCGCYLTLRQDATGAWVADFGERK